MTFGLMSGRRKEGREKGAMEGGREGRIMDYREAPTTRFHLENYLHHF